MSLLYPSSSSVQDADGLAKDMKAASVPQHTNADGHSCQLVIRLRFISRPKKQKASKADAFYASFCI